MSTHADFYIGRGLTAEFLGSIYTEGFPDGAPEILADCSTEEEFRATVYSFAEDEHLDLVDFYRWPWEDSNGTDYSYALDKGVVYYSCLGEGWFVLTKDMETVEVSEGETNIYPSGKSINEALK